MPQRDTLDKVVGVYVKNVSREPFTYREKMYTPKPLRLSPLLLRGFTCPAGCGGCCPRFSLDYLPGIEPIPYVSTNFQIRQVEFNGRPVNIMSDMQADHNNHHCRNLDMTNGRCTIHSRNPFSCDFELLRFIEYQDPGKPNMLISKLFGRGWSMLRVDDDRGALCTMTPVNDATVQDVVRKIKRLEEWCDHFGITDNRCADIVAWCLSDQNHQPLTLE